MISQTVEKENKSGRNDVVSRVVFQKHFGIERLFETHFFRCRLQQVEKLLSDYKIELTFFF